MFVFLIKNFQFKKKKENKLFRRRRYFADVYLKLNAIFSMYLRYNLFTGLRQSIKWASTAVNRYRKYIFEYEKIIACFRRLFFFRLILIFRKNATAIWAMNLCKIIFKLFHLKKDVTALLHERRGIKKQILRNSNFYAHPTNNKY
jgi:hypothetical protein